MDIQSLSALVVKKFKDAGGYSELEDKALYRSIYKFLDMKYRRNFKLIKEQLAEEEASGVAITKEKYEAAYLAVEDIVMDYANKLAATDAAHLE